VDVFETYISSKFGRNIEWRIAVNQESGDEGFYIKCTSQLGPADIMHLKEQTHRHRKDKKEHAEAEYFRNLHEGWVQHHEYLENEQCIKDMSPSYTHAIDRNLQIPFLDLPPSYNDIEGLNNRTQAQSTLGESLGARHRHSASADFYFDSYGYPTGHRPFISPTINEPSSNFRAVDSLSVNHNYAGSNETAALGRNHYRTHSATDLRSQHLGYAYQPNQRLSRSTEELFLGPLESSMTQPKYADGLPVWGRV